MQICMCQIMVTSLFCSVETDKQRLNLHSSFNQSFTFLTLTDKARPEAWGVGSHKLWVQLPFLKGREDSQQSADTNTDTV